MRAGAAIQNGSFLFGKSLTNFKREAVGGGGAGGSII